MFFYNLFLIFAFLIVCQSKSSGSLTQDALGLCKLASSGAFIKDKKAYCPKGMHKVLPPTRTDAYSVRAGDQNPIQDPDAYEPDSIIDIHLRVLHRDMKYIGLLMYAVQAGVHSIKGCNDGCDGLKETKVGSWIPLAPNNFKKSLGDEKVITHSQSRVARRHEVFRFRTPKSGTGPIIFRVLLKQGATNGGAFYWPMMKGDLQLLESKTAAPSPVVWLQAKVGQTCSTACNAVGKTCQSNTPATPNVYQTSVKNTASCRYPILSDCLIGSVRIDADNYCTFDDRALCKAGTSPNDICGNTVLGGKETSLCPCAFTTDICTPNDCSNHGSTNDTNRADGCQCTCTDGYTGANCAIPPAVTGMITLNGDFAKVQLSTARFLSECTATLRQVSAGSTVHCSAVSVGINLTLLGAAIDVNRATDYIKKNGLKLSSGEFTYKGHTITLNHASPSTNSSSSDNTVGLAFGVIGVLAFFVGCVAICNCYKNQQIEKRLSEDSSSFPHPPSVSNSPVKEGQTDTGRGSDSGSASTTKFPPQRPGRILSNSRVKKFPPNARKPLPPPYPPRR